MARAPYLMEENERFRERLRELEMETDVEMEPDVEMNEDIIQSYSEEQKFGASLLFITSLIAQGCAAMTGDFWVITGMAVISVPIIYGVRNMANDERWS